MPQINDLSIGLSGIPAGSSGASAASTQTIFCEETIGAYPDSGNWSEPWLSRGVSTVETVTTPVGTEAFEFNTGLDREVLQRWKDPLDDGEIVALVQISNTADGGIRVWHRTDGTGASTNWRGYAVYLDFAGTPEQLGFFKYGAGGAFSLIGTAVDPGFTAVNGQWTWVRFNIQGSSLKAKAWKDGDSEPGAWQAEETDTELTEGYPGIGNWEGSSLFRCGFFSFISTGSASDTWDGTCP